MRVAGTNGNDSIKVNRKNVTIGTASFDADAERLSLDARGGNDTIDIAGTDRTVATVLNGSDGDDTFRVNTPSSGGQTENSVVVADVLNGQVTVTGDDGTDSLLLDDHDDTTGDTLTINESVIGAGATDTYFGTPGDSIAYSALESLSAYCGTGNDAVTLQGPAALLALSLFSNPGADRLTVDLSNGEPIPTVGMSYDGGIGMSDTLAVSGSSGPDDVIFSTGTATVAGRPITQSNVGAVFFDGRGGLDDVRILSGPTVVFPATQHLQALNIASGSAASMSLNGANVLFTQSLSLANGATLDLNDNDLLLDYTGGSQLAPVQQLINTARANGAWTGTGLTSSGARNNPQHNTTLAAMEATDYQSIYGASATFDGELIDSTAVLVKYTYYGDADFNGRVNFDDYVRTDNGFNNHRSGWLNGDFDGNSSVNFDDYVLIDLAFNSQGGILGRSTSAGSSALRTRVR